LAEAEELARIVADILADWSSSDLAFVKSGRASLGAVGRRIRNEYELWNPQCSLTRRWHACPKERDIRDGIDFSIDHPDSVSERIENLLREALQ
jgi:hypothetical protein